MDGAATGTVSAERRRRIRRSGIALGLVALAFFLGFIAVTLLRGQVG